MVKADLQCEEDGDPLVVVVPLVLAVLLVLDHEAHAGGERVRLDLRQGHGALVPAVVGQEGVPLGAVMAEARDGLAEQVVGDGHPVKKSQKDKESINRNQGTVQVSKIRISAPLITMRRCRGRRW